MDILEGLDANMLALEVLLDGHRPSSLPEERDGFAADPNADRSKRTGQGVRTCIQTLLDDKIFLVEALDVDQATGPGNREAIEELPHDRQSVLDPRALRLG